MWPLLILVVVVALLSAPVALVVSLVVLSRVRRLERQYATRPVERLVESPSKATRPLTEEGRVGSQPTRSEPDHDNAWVKNPRYKTEPKETTVPKPLVGPLPEPRVEIPPTDAAQSANLEQRIGTRWVLIAGVVTVIFAVGYFLKYAYDNQWIGPLGRVVCAVVAGLVALGVGEVTRRRSYDIVAKGVTALGFAILYAAVFAAHRWYALIDATPAYVLAIGITVAGMLYAVTLNEIVAALLALVGGYITPIVISTGQNAPTLLFGYVLILSAGALLCAYWRKWPALNVAAFLGTFALYTGWFEQFYRPAMRPSETPEQLGVALFWLAVFFVVYLVLPILHGLVRRVKSETSDVVLVLVNAAVVFYYLMTMLIADHRTSLALCSLAMGAIHLTMTVVVFLRCREDINLQHSLLTAGLAFATLAIPLYFRAYAIVMAWAVEAVVLTVIGLRYRNTLAQIASGIVGVLAIGQLVLQLPLHAETFRLYVNPEFGAWCFAGIAILVCHILYRIDKHLDPPRRSVLADALYATGLLVLLTAVSLELWYHCDLNLKGRAFTHFALAIMPVPSIFLLFCFLRPISPCGKFSLSLGVLLAIAGAFLFVFSFSETHRQSYAIFMNLPFFWVLVFVAALFASAWFLSRLQPTGREPLIPLVFLPLIAIVLLWIMLTQEIWCYWRCRSPQPTDWRFLAHMYISVLWAVYATILMVIGFWRNIKFLRYIALSGFVLLLGKIFLIDTRTLESVYRIAGFLVTGLALVGVSYLYQFLKNRGFFDKMLAEKDTKA